MAKPIYEGIQPDPAVIARLRMLVIARHDPLQIMAAIHVAMGRCGWVSDCFYLVTALRVAVGELHELQGWHRYGGDLSDDEFSAVLSKLIERHRGEWG